MVTSGPQSYLGRIQSSLPSDFSSGQHSQYDCPNVALTCEQKLRSRKSQCPHFSFHWAVVLVPTLSLATHVTLGKLLNIPRLPFPHLQNGTENELPSRVAVCVADTMHVLRVVPGFLKSSIRVWCPLLFLSLLVHGY